MLRRHGLRVLGSGVMLPIVQAASVGASALLFAAGVAGLVWLLLGLVLAGAVVQSLALLEIYALSRAPRWTIPLFPLGCWVVGRILMKSARDLEKGNPIVWGGRNYVLEPR